MKKFFKKLNTKSQQNNNFIVIVRIIICLIVLGAGIIAFIGLSSIKPKPKEKDSDYLIKTLITVPVKKENISDIVVGYGTAEPTDEINVKSQISGKVIYIMPNLEDGILVDKNTILAKIEKTDYEVILNKVVADIKAYKAKLAVLKQEIIDNKEIYKILENKLNLEEASFNRKKRLYEKQAVSAQVFEDSEQAYIGMKQTCLNMKRDITKAELEIDSITANIERSEAEKKQAELDISRCEIKSPIKGRLENVAIEKNEYISKGQQLFNVADDSTLIIPVPLDTRDISSIITRISVKTNGYKHWFTYDKNTPVKIMWTENPEKCIWDGKIVRIEKFDPETRTVVIAVKASKFIGKERNKLPLVAGMYCQVDFTGKELKNVVRIPWSALQLNGHVYVVDKNNTVHEKDVNILSSRQDRVIISSGLETGEKVITQRIPYGVVNGSKVKTVTEQ